MKMKVAASAIEFIKIEPIPIAIRPNLVRNPSFEEVKNRLPVYWEWDKRNTNATILVDESVAASGKRSLKFTNSTPFGSHIYAILKYTEPLPVKPNTIYTLSCRLKCRGAYVGFLGGGQEWHVRLPLNDTGGQWKRISVPFATTDSETNFELVIVLEAPTPGLWLDDLKLEEGETASFFEPPLEEPTLYWEPPQVLYLQSDHWRMNADFYTSQPLSHLSLQVQVGKEVKSLTPQLLKGFNRIEFGGQVLPSLFGSPQPVRLHLELPSGKKLVFQYKVRFFTPQEATQRLQALQKRLPGFKRALEQLPKRQIDPAYPLASYAVLEDFTGYVAQDLRKGLTERAYEQLGELEEIANRLQKTLRAVLAGKQRLPSVPRYVTSKIEIQGPSLIADTVEPITGKRKRRPVFFVGFGHFGQVRADIEKFSRYGFNLIQIEMGPSDIFPEEGKVSTEKLKKDILPVLRRAAKANVAVDLLLSPHYFPNWMLQKYPDLRVRREGFLQYSPYAPEAQQLLQNYIKTVVPPLKGQPALLSLCLSNEPINVEEPGSLLQQLEWHQWLIERHKNLLNLNSRWQTQYQDWAEIPVPSPSEPTRYVEWCLFNQEWFAKWHQRLAEGVKRLAPSLPVHAKLMTWNFFSPEDQRYGIDPELFASFCDFHGNDAATFYTYEANAAWANRWITTLMGHDLQRSLKDAPVFNSEYHVIPDRERRQVPPVHVRNALWQAAVHGLSATTFWVWERTDDPQSDFAGSLLHRPACVEALAHTTLDLQRLAPYICALQKKEPDVYLLHSSSALVRQGEEVATPLENLYITLNMVGLKVGFLTERQLLAGFTPNLSKPVLVADIQHLSDDAYANLQQFVIFGGKVGRLNERVLRYDHYNRDRTGYISGELISRIPKLPPHELVQDLLKVAPYLNMKPPVELYNPDGKPVWGIAHRTAPYGKGFVTNLCNYTQKPITFQLRRPGGRPVRARNLLTNQPLPSLTTLQPLEPLLIYWE